MMFIVSRRHRCSLFVGRCRRCCRRCLPDWPTCLDAVFCIAVGCFPSLIRGLVPPSHLSPGLVTALTRPACPPVRCQSVSQSVSQSESIRLSIRLSTCLYRHHHHHIALTIPSIPEPPSRSVVPGPLARV